MDFTESERHLLLNGLGALWESINQDRQWSPHDSDRQSELMGRLLQIEALETKLQSQGAGV